MTDLQGISHRVNAAIKAVDPQHYACADDLRRKIGERFSFARGLNALDPLVMEGKEILYNVSMGPHFDRTDPPLGWGVDCAFGYHKGGHFICPQLGLRIRFEPGDMLMLRGRMVKHSVEPWTGGQRISMPHFSHSATWRMMRMETLVGLNSIPDPNEYLVDYDAEDVDTFLE
jgi:hypothetical protein